MEKRHSVRTATLEAFLKDVTDLKDAKKLMGLMVYELTVLHRRVDWLQSKVKEKEAVH